MKITSPDFKNGEKIPDKNTCEGADVNPNLQFSDIPQDAQSLVLIVDDPDAPSKTWVHWIIYNINPQITQIHEDSVPENAGLGITDFAKPGYGGPCPPKGEHRYFFRLYALDKMLDMTEDPDRITVEEAMKDHVIDTANFWGVYSR